MYKNNFLDNINLYTILFLFIVDFLLVLFIHTSWNTSITTIQPLSKKVTTLRNDLSEAHLWLEEVLGGDESIDIKKDVFELFEHKEFKSFLKENLPKKYTDIKSDLNEIDIKLDHIYLLAQNRLKDSLNKGIGSKDDQSFDKEFKETLSLIDNTIEKINSIAIRTIEEKNRDFKLVITFLVFINILLFLLLFLVKKYRKKLQQNETILIQNSKLASMGEMLENIAHQWRQPLNTIATGTTSLKIKHDLGSLNDTYFDEVIVSINKNVQYLSQTIDDFSKFTKKDKEKVQFNLKDNIYSFIKIIESSLKTYKIKTMLNLEDNIVLKNYPNELNQVLMVLYNNTKDAFKSHSNENEKYIFISTKTKENLAVLEFKDNAGGINETIINKIFEPYFTTKHQAEGTGLGLHISYNIIVNSMKGLITVENDNFSHEEKKYKGAKFTISIPLEDREN